MLRGIMALSFVAVLFAAAALMMNNRIPGPRPGTTAEESPAEPRPPGPNPTEKKDSVMPSRSYKKPSADELKKKLTSMQFTVTQQNGTEPPFRNEFYNNHEAGLYVDIASGEPLFSSTDKFESGTGWPSFTRPVDAERVIKVDDISHGMVRSEVRSKDGDSHLGHVFDDGPKPTGLRYCINSASLRFIPAAKLEAEGYGDYAKLFNKDAKPVAAMTDNTCTVPAAGGKAGCETTMEVAILAGGCFWGMEEIIRKIPGVIETDVGYTGGTIEKPTYQQVKQGNTGHAEAIQVTFDPKKLSYADLLEKWFFKMHDPTTANRQGNDVGSQYRSAIFYTTDEQKKVAEEVKTKVQLAGKWKKPIVTEIVKAGAFTKAEDYHQDYLEKNPGGYTCHYMRE